MLTLLLCAGTAYAYYKCFVKAAQYSKDALEGSEVVVRQALKLVRHIPRALALLSSPPYARSFNGPATAWLRLVQLPRAFASIFVVGDGSGSNQLVTYLLVLPAGGVAAVALVALLYRWGAARPLLKALWRARTTAFTSALALASTCLLDDAWRRYIATGALWWGAARLAAGAALSATTVFVALPSTTPSPSFSVSSGSGNGAADANAASSTAGSTGSDLPLRRRRRALYVAALHACAISFASATSALLVGYGNGWLAALVTVPMAAAAAVGSSNADGGSSSADSSSSAGWVGDALGSGSSKGSGSGGGLPPDVASSAAACGWLLGLVSLEWWGQLAESLLPLLLPPPQSSGGNNGGNNGGHHDGNNDGAREGHQGLFASSVSFVNQWRHRHLVRGPLSLLAVLVMSVAEKGGGLMRHGWSWLCRRVVVPLREQVLVPGLKAIVRIDKQALRATNRFALQPALHAARVCVKAGKAAAERAGNAIGTAWRRVHASVTHVWRRHMQPVVQAVGRMAAACWSRIQRGWDATERVVRRIATAAKRVCVRLLNAATRAGRAAAKWGWRKAAACWRLFVVHVARPTGRLVVRMATHWVVRGVLLRSLWPMGAVACATGFARQAALQGRVVPFGLCALVCGAVACLMSGKELKKWRLFKRAGIALEGLGAFVYVNMDLGMVRLGLAVVQIVWPIAKQTMRVAGRTVKAAVVLLFGLVDMFGGALARGLAMLLRTVWRGVWPVIKGIRSCLSNLGRTIWSSPEAALGASLSVLAAVYLGHRTGVGAVVGQAAVAALLPLKMAASTVLMAGSYGLSAVHFVLTSALHVSGSSASAGFRAATLMGSWAGGAVGDVWTRVFGNATFAHTFFGINLVQALMLRAWRTHVLHAVFRNDPDASAVHSALVSFLARSTLKALMAPLAAASLIVALAAAAGSAAEAASVSALASAASVSAVVSADHLPFSGVMDSTALNGTLTGAAMGAMEQTWGLMGGGGGTLSTVAMVLVQRGALMVLGWLLGGAGWLLRGTHWVACSTPAWWLAYISLVWIEGASRAEAWDERLRQRQRGMQEQEVALAAALAEASVAATQTYTPPATAGSGASGGGGTGGGGGLSEGHRAALRSLLLELHAQPRPDHVFMDNDDSDACCPICFSDLPPIVDPCKAPNTPRNDDVQPGAQLPIAEAKPAARSSVWRRWRGRGGGGGGGAAGQGTGAGAAEVVAGGSTGSTGGENQNQQQEQQEPQEQLEWDADVSEVLCCGHVFHRACVLQWLARGAAKRCPVCREHVMGRGRIANMLF